MFGLLLVLFSLRNALAVEYPYPKCCDSDSILEKINSTYICTKDLNKRTQIVLNETNFLNSSDEGFCVDVEKTVSLFKSNGSDLSKVEDLDVDFYPKCCPVDFFYNSSTYACVKSEKKLDTFFRESFVRVGLPQCKIIVDVTVNVNKYFEGFNASLYFKKRSFEGDNLLHCIDRDQNNSLIVRVCHDDFNICDRIRCVRKCCPDGQSFVNGSKCRNTFVHGLDFSAFSGNMENVNDPVAIIHDGFTPPIYPLIPTRFHFHLDAKGVFTMTERDDSLGNINVTRHYEPEKKVYCMEHAIKGGINNYLFFRGFPQQTQFKYVYTGIAMTISCFFLLLTIIYYCISDEKKTLFGRILISYCVTSLLAFLFHSSFSFTTVRPRQGVCNAIAFLLFYLTLSIFTWMNIMCIDIYCTFGSSKSFLTRQHKNRELKRFLLYSLHGWGTPLFLTVIPLIFYHVQNLPWAIRVIINEQKCLIFKGDENYAQFIFSTIPMLILQICNLTFFVKTVFYCLQVKREINKMNDTHVLKGEKRQKFNKFRDRFGLLLKLFFIMGISFLFEVVSVFYDFKKTEVTAVIEIIWDTFNSLQGLFIFLIFILKKRIFKKIENKVGFQKLRKISLVSSAMTQITTIPAVSK